MPTPENNIERRQAVQTAIKAFATTPLPKAALQLLNALGYASDKTADLGSNAESMLSNIEQFKPELGKISRDKVKAERWRSCSFLFQLTNDEIPSLAIGQTPLGADSKLAGGQIESFVFLTIELRGVQWSRVELTSIVRELNRRFPMPVIVLFKHDEGVSLAIIDRRAHLKDATKDVVDSRITVIKDVRLANPHRAHLDILVSIALENLGDKRRPINFRELYDAWIAALSIQTLNEKFYRELAWWYLWAVKEVQLPVGGGNDRNAIGVIRLLTRLIFVWFIKERSLVPDALFEPEALARILKQRPDQHPEEGNYYNAILQNLFFATLNVETGEDSKGKRLRRWAETGSSMKGDYLISLVYRYQSAFQNPDEVLDTLFGDIPFLNGGLFECLDEGLSEKDFERNPAYHELASKEGNNWALRIDGFSRRAETRAQVPNKLFFGGTDDAKLNAEFDTKGKRYPVSGLIDILNRYKFTIDENTPLDEEVALDPELLGKVFENLLASYNPDTRSTARKKSGSFYTPREVVDFMVNEALIQYFRGKLGDTGEIMSGRLRWLLSHADTGHEFSEDEADRIVAAIESLRVLDPACGSGAFPMGILAKLFIVLNKLDPENRRWREQNLAPLKQRLAGARRTPDPLQRDAEISDAEAAIEKHERDFSDPAYADYTRKLYLIEKCIFGSDIQPIAVQIAKLRFFIALIVSQPIDRNKPNWNITPLPNLETKIVAANTLFGVPRHGTQGSLLDDPAIAEKEAELRDANAAYFTSRTRAIKKRRKEKVQKLHDELVTLLRRDGFVTVQDADRMARWDPFDQNRFADFFDVEWMYGMPRAKDHSEAVFDIVIGNPPYVRQEEIKELKPLLKDVYKYECYTGTADLFVYFYERSIKLLKPHGIISFITSNKWYRAKYGEPLRQFMATHTRLNCIIDFGDEKVFEAIAYPTIVIATRRERPINPPPEEDTVHALNWQQAHPIEHFPMVFQAEAFEVPQTDLKKTGWHLEPPLKRQLLARLRAAGKPLGEYVNGRFYYGIKTGLNDAFVIDGATRARLIAEDPMSIEIIKPFLRGRDVKRWRVEPQDLWLVFTRRPFDIKKYQAIYTHLAKFRKQLEPKPESWDDKQDGIWQGRKAGSYEWFEIQDNIAYWQEFEQPKIVFPDIALSPQFAWDSGGRYLANTAYIIPGVERWMLSILNSAVCAWFYSQISPQIQNGYYRFIAQYCEQIPIPPIKSIHKVLLEAVVRAIQETNDPRFEQLVNGLVYELFFSQELAHASIQLFYVCEKANLARLATLDGSVLRTAAEELAATIFATNHPIYAMLFDLQGLDIVRLIEGRE